MAKKTVPTDALDAARVETDAKSEDDTKPVNVEEPTLPTKPEKVVVAAPASAPEPAKKYIVKHKITISMGPHMVTLQAGKVLDSHHWDINKLVNSGVALEPYAG